jgi:hypothetical protein
VPQIKFNLVQSETSPVEDWEGTSSAGIFHKLLLHVICPQTVHLLGATIRGNGQNEVQQWQKRHGIKVARDCHPQCHQAWGRRGISSTGTAPHQHDVGVPQWRHVANCPCQCSGKSNPQPNHHHSQRQVESGRGKFLKWMVRAPQPHQ